MDELPVYLTLKQALNWVLFRNPSKLNVSTMVELLAFSDWVDTEDETVIKAHCENPLDSPIAIPGLLRSTAEGLLCAHLRLHGAVVLNTRTISPVEVQPFEFAGCSIGYDLEDTHIRYETTFGRMEGVHILSEPLIEEFPPISTKAEITNPLTPSQGYRNTRKIDYSAVIVLAISKIDDRTYRNAHHAAQSLASHWWKKTGNASEEAFIDQLGRAVRTTIANRDTANNSG